MNFTCSLSKVKSELHYCNVFPMDSFAFRNKFPIAIFASFSEFVPVGGGSMSAIKCSDALNPSVLQF